MKVRSNSFVAVKPLIQRESEEEHAWTDSQDPHDTLLFSSRDTSSEMLVNECQVLSTSGTYRRSAESPENRAQFPSIVAQEGETCLCCCV